jgi:hypothetical protein
MYEVRGTLALMRDRTSIGCDSLLWRTRSAQGGGLDYRYFVERPTRIMTFMTLRCSYLFARSVAIENCPPYAQGLVRSPRCRYISGLLSTTSNLQSSFQAYGELNLWDVQMEPSMYRKRRPSLLLHAVVTRLRHVNARWKIGKDPTPNCSETDYH